MTEDDEIVQAFLEESRENLDQLDRDLVELEARPRDPELLAQVYRAIHTVKGTCGFLGYDRLEALTHAGEDLLDALRSGRLLLDVEIVTSLLGLIDAVRAALARIDATGDEGPDAHRSTIAALTACLNRTDSPSTAGPRGDRRAASDRRAGGARTAGARDGSARELGARRRRRARQADGPRR